MDSRDIIAQHIANVHAFETSREDVIPQVASTESMSTLQGDKSSPSTSAGESSRPTVSRIVTGKSLTSVPTNTDVDALVRILSRRTTTGTGGQSEFSAQMTTKLNLKKSWVAYSAIPKTIYRDGKMSVSSGSIFLYRLLPLLEARAADFGR